MSYYHIRIDGDKVTAKNINSGAIKNFTIRHSEDEINGRREYLVDNTEHLRVRLFNRSDSGLQDAVVRYAEGYLDNRLYRHPV